MKDLAKMCLTAIISLLAVIVCCLVCSSCQASRNIETQKQIDYSDDFNRIQSVIQSLRADVSRQTKITNDRLSNLKLENKTVYLSAPDSVGKQHVVKESTTTASKQEQERTEVDETVSVTLQHLSNMLDTLSNKVDAILNLKENIVELSWWDLHKDNVYCCIIGLLIVSWLWDKLRKKYPFH